MKKWMGKHSTLQVILALSSIFLCAILFVGSLALFVQDVTRRGSFPPGSRVAEVDISGLDRTEALAKCRRELAEVASRPVVLEVGERKISTTPEELGLHLDYEKMVDDAWREAWSPSVVERMFRSLVNRQKVVAGAITAQNDDRLVEEFVKRATDAANQPPVNAYVDVTSGRPVIVQSSEGYAVLETAVRSAIYEAENSKSRVVRVRAKKVKPAFDDSIYGRLIIVNLSEHKLTLYDRETPVAEFGIACGQPAWPTPTGQWKIIGKLVNPTWTNPRSSWSAGMPAKIGPGYNNPLGLRALPLNAAGVLIHGTASSWSIGTSASHGCIRMHMSEVISLFDMVEVDTPVYIIHGAGNPGFDVARTPQWRLEEDR